MKKLTLPGSKSITNRDLILASLVEGKTILHGCLDSKDTKYMIEALKDFGIEIEKLGDFSLEINSGLSKLKNPGKEIFLGQSGTCIRFLLGLAVLVSEKEIIFTGEERLLERPLKDLLEGLEQIGIESEHKLGEYIKIKRTGNKNNSKIKMNGESSSQFFTSLLQIAPMLENGLEIEVLGDLVSKPYIDITINEMEKFGVKVENKDYKYFKVLPQKYYLKNSELNIEGDASALSYIACFIALHSGEIEIENIGNNSKQGDYKFLDLMKIFGLEYSSDMEKTILKAPGIKNIDLKKFSDYEIDFEDMPDVSMSFMIMSIFLSGNTKITGLQTLNLKECLRIDAMRDELQKLGIEVESDEKSITIGEFHEEKYSKTGKIDIETYNDHRIAMCFGTLNTYIGNLNILNPKCVSKTYPNFWEDLEYLGK